MLADAFDGQFVAVDDVVELGDGDIRTIRENTLSGNTRASETFFETEYRVIRLLAHYDHPVIALIDGICMGGGLGISVHGPYRVVTDHASLAMPETAIGFFPDVGASHFLSRLPGALGMYLGLTGVRIGSADAIYSSLATHFCHSADLPEIVRALGRRGHSPAETVLRSFARPTPDDGQLAGRRADIDWCFGAPSLEAVMSRLKQLATPWAHE